jgi:hypothetical protein
MNIKSFITQLNYAMPIGQRLIFRPLIILKALFFDKPIQIVARGSATYRKHDLIMNLVLAALVLGLTFSLLYPTPLLSFIHRATMALMYL